MGRGISGPQHIHRQEITGNKTAMLFLHYNNNGLS